MTLKITTDEMRQIAFFEGMTGAHVKDCVINEEGGLITYVVKEGEMGMAIGKSGSNVRRAEHLVGKAIEVVEYSETPEKFIKNLLVPARVKSVSISEHEGKKVAVVRIEMEDKKVAVGRKGRKIQNVKKIAERHLNISDVILR